MYQALYRKYRPKNFDDVVGQEHITVTLKQEISSGRVGHAYLFTGSRGTGKTTCSKIIAKAVNCPNQQDGNPCGVCDICKGIDDGSILDVTEIDAASNNGVDNIRQLREEANFTPAVTKYRVYIIDETHMLSVGAFNALLKIMEEPPEHVIFILATTEVHKIPATILSRCQRFDFRRIDPKVIAERVKYVCQQENILIDEDAASLIARLAEGGMRDALSLLDVCRSNARNPENQQEHITAEHVRSSAGLAMSDCLFSIADAVLKQDVPAILKEIDTMFLNSIDFEKMCVQLISHYRGLMMAKALKSPADFVPGLSQDIQALTEQASRYSMGQILYSLTVLQDTLSRMSKTSQTRTELEMAVIKLSNPSLDRSVDAILARLSKLENQLKSGMVSIASSAAQTAQVSVEKPSADTVNQTAQPVAAPGVTSTAPSADIQPLPSPSKKEVSIFEEWPQVLDALRHTNNALHGALINTTAYRYQEIILIDCDNPLFLEMIRTNEYAKKSIHQALIAGSGRDWRIGPFKKDQYEAKKDDPLEDILSTAQNLGVDISIEN
ncbi:MAG: DNA polymerase III subunit gamma/tau [Negativibacillus massiliensis]|uniref:DNA polymerase III subunit gamma/tau n=2 Tax=Negativibacillus massiliensis TaxID=1871035 RepID=UPI000340ACD1|nr:DNA polymerase III subunit gamma/tau [Negativibacillus massiliensis]MCI6348264.1 DNA polymerase III subunit gamma/tau [Negativibacillus massiliensis]CDA79462.1 dNA polymerase III subunit gamma and tau [Clostridium sp. CAG:242]